MRGSPLVFNVIELLPWAAEPRHPLLVTPLQVRDHQHDQDEEDDDGGEDGDQDLDHLVVRFIVGIGIGVGDLDDGNRGL